METNVCIDFQEYIHIFICKQQKLRQWYFAVRVYHISLYIGCRCWGSSRLKMSILSSPEIGSFHHQTSFFDQEDRWQLPLAIGTQPLQLLLVHLPSIQSKWNLKKKIEWTFLFHYLQQSLYVWLHFFLRKIGFFHQCMHLICFEW